MPWATEQIAALMPRSQSNADIIKEKRHWLSDVDILNYSFSKTKKVTKEIGYKEHELHHLCSRSMGGSDNPRNIVPLLSDIANLLEADNMFLNV